MRSLDLRWVPLTAYFGDGVLYLFIKFSRIHDKGDFIYLFIFWYQSKGPKVTTEERDPPLAYERGVDND